MRHCVVFLLCCLALTVLAEPGHRSQQQGDDKKIKFRFQYAAPFACGNVQGSDAQLINGQYATTVMIHNPEEKARANIRKKVALSFPAQGKGGADAQKAGAVSKFLTQSLGADEALEVDCGEIMGEDRKGGSEFFNSKSNAFGKSTFSQGFVVIESDVSLDVERVITAGNNEEIQEERECPKKKEHHKKKDHGKKEEEQEEEEKKKWKRDPGHRQEQRENDGKKKEEERPQEKKRERRMVERVQALDVAPVRERKLKK